MGSANSFLSRRFSSSSDFSQRASREYLEHPCAIPNGSCIIHKLGVPQVDIVAEVTCANLPEHHLQAAGGVALALGFAPMSF